MGFKWLDRGTVYTPYLTLCLSEKDYIKACKHLKDNCPSPWLGKDANASTHTYENKEKITCIVCLDENKIDDQVALISVLVHEAVHVFQQMCESIGETKPSAEFHAYSIEKISYRLINEYRRQRDARNKKAHARRSAGLG